MSTGRCYRAHRLKTRSTSPPFAVCLARYRFGETGVSTSTSRTWESFVRYAWRTASRRGIARITFDRVLEHWCQIISTGSGPMRAYSCSAIPFLNELHASPDFDVGIAALAAGGIPPAWKLESAGFGTAKIPLASSDNAWPARNAFGSWKSVAHRCLRGGPPSTLAMPNGINEPASYCNGVSSVSAAGYVAGAANGFLISRHRA